MSVVEGAGARLYYEAQGSGPLLVVIPAATGDARFFTTVGEHLAEYYTVVTYDRRGFSRSPLDGQTPGGHVAAGSHPAELSRTLHQALGEQTASAWATDREEGRS